MAQKRPVALNGLNNEGGVELHEKKQSREKMKIGKRIKNKQISFQVTRAWDCFTTVICIMYLY